LDFFSEFGDMAKLMYIAMKYDQLAKRKTIKKNELEGFGVTEDVMRQFSETETETRADDIDAVKYVEDLGYTEADIEDCQKYKYKDEDGNKAKIPNGYSMKKVLKKFPASDEFIMQHATKVVVGSFSDIHKRDLLIYLFDNARTKKTTLTQIIKNQVSLLGNIVYTDTTLDKRYIVVTALDTTYSPKFKAYCIATGQTVELKVHKSRNPRDKTVKTSFRDEPFTDGDILYMKKATKKPKVTKVGDKWVESPTEIVWWLEDYSKENL
jgi:DNA polymerase-3 subunit alpha